jgi:hypothetical protein
MINILTALSTMNGGVREILPFVRYISQFIDFEFNAIQGQNQGQGVVCAATWYAFPSDRNVMWLMRLPLFCQDHACCNGPASLGLYSTAS